MKKGVAPKAGHPFLTHVRGPAYLILIFYAVGLTGATGQWIIEKIGGIFG